MNTGIFIIFGMKIGTCITAILASIGTGVSAKRAAAIHLIYNIVSVNCFYNFNFNLGLPYVRWIEALVTG
jgi:phosphate:Na+ symporter